LCDIIYGLVAVCAVTSHNKN